MADLAHDDNGGESSVEHRTAARDTQFTALYEEHYASIRAYASASVPTGEVDDIVAEAFLVAWRRWDDIPHDWARGWLIGVARNVVRARHRTSKRATGFLDQLSLDRSAAPAATVDEQPNVQVEMLTAALGTLKSSDQEILILTGTYDLSLEDLALALNINSSTAGVRIHRARERLRVAFAKQVEDTASDATSDTSKKGTNNGDGGEAA
jgi:RNA polymerase sigma-70 factor (ECF subfamily)